MTCGVVKDGRCENDATSSRFVSEVPTLGNKDGCQEDDAGQDGEGGNEGSDDLLPSHLIVERRKNCKVESQDQEGSRINSNPITKTVSGVDCLHTLTLIIASYSPVESSTA